MNHSQLCAKPAALAALFLLCLSAAAQPVIRWEAYNDYRPSGLTHVNATTYDLRITDDGGVLKNIQTGADLTAAVRVVAEGTPDDFGAISFAINPGSPAAKVFEGFVDTGGPNNPGLPGVHADTGITLTLVFEKLDPTKRYVFKGVVARAGGYNNRWSVFTILGTEAYVHAHEDGSNNKNIFTKTGFAAATIETNEVVLNTGDNRVGSLVVWNNIEPGPDGSFEILARQYMGPTPFGNNPPHTYAYGFNAIYLAEIESTGNLRITENPATQLLPAGQTATLRVVASSPQPIIYQWQKAAPGTTNFVNVADATSSSYTTAALTAADDGAKYRVLVTSAGITTTSGEATLSVDASIPTALPVRGSVNHNAVHVTFSEAMNLETLADTNNYRLSGGLQITSAVALDPSNARLLTSPQTPGTAYTLTLNNLADRAGNKIAANTALNFNAFAITTNTVGVDLWYNIGGSAVQNLRDYARYPNDPNVDYPLPAFDTFLLPTLTNIDNNSYGGRFRAWLVPEEAGDYEFFIRADDQGEFRISVDDSFANFDDPQFVMDNPPQAADTSGNDGFQETGFDASVSAPIRLEKGKRYAVQAIWKEVNGVDWFQLAWRKAGDATPADQLTPIPSKFFSYYGPVAQVAAPRFTRISRSGANAVIEWTGGGTLESAPTVTGPWTAVANATSPLTVPATGTRFYRLR